VAIEHDGSRLSARRHLHHVHGDHVDEHVLAVNGTNGAACTPSTPAADTTRSTFTQQLWTRGVPHGDHVDYLVQVICTIPTATIAMTMVPEGQDVTALPRPLAPPVTSWSPEGT